MNVRRGFDQVGNWGIAWLLLCLSFAANILDDTLNDFPDFQGIDTTTRLSLSMMTPSLDRNPERRRKSAANRSTMKVLSDYPDCPSRETG